MGTLTISPDRESMLKEFAKSANSNLVEVLHNVEKLSAVFIITLESTSEGMVSNTYLSSGMVAFELPIAAQAIAEETNKTLQALAESFHKEFSDDPVAG